jgi:hypothetical protein
MLKEVLVFGIRFLALWKVATLLEGVLKVHLLFTR